MHRRQFLHTASWLLACPLIEKVQRTEAPFIMTVNGQLPASEMGISLIHEHIMVDFIGAAQWKPGRYNEDTVISTVLPFLQEVMQQRVNTFVDCTPAFLGRDVQLLQRLSKRTGLQIITNTGYYGASKEKFIPAKVYKLTPEAIAAEWIKEYEAGIEGTGIRPGFIKSGVDVSPLSKVQQKLVHAAAITHLKTGLPIAIHTGNGDASLEQIRILQAAGVDAVAYIWVHAQSEKEKKYHFKVAGEEKGWLSFDGVGPDSVNEYVTRLTYLKEANLLHRVLVSHDAGWYDVGGTEGSKYRGHTTIFTTLIPALQQKGFTEADIRQLLITNPASAFSIRVHRKV